MNVECCTRISKFVLRTLYFVLKIYNMQRIAFKMKLFKGYEAEYQRRHDAIWPELCLLLHEKGIQDYSIFLDAATGDLFGVLKVHDSIRLEELPHEPIMK